MRRAIIACLSQRLLVSRRARRVFQPKMSSSLRLQVMPLMNSEVVQQRATPAEKLQLNMVQVVRTVPLFASLRERDWEEVASQLTGSVLPPRGLHLLRRGPPENLYVVWMGQVKLVRHSVDGRDVVLDVLGPGRLLGEVAVFEGRAYSQTAQAMEEVAAIAIARNDYLDLLQRYPTLALAVINELGRRLRVPTTWCRAWPSIASNSGSPGPCSDWRCTTAPPPKMA